MVMDIVTVKTRQPQLGCAHGREAGGFSGNELVLPRQKGEKQRPLVFAGAPKPLGGRAYTTPPSLWQTDELDLEIWPTCIVIPPGHRLAFTIQAHDLERETAPGRSACWVPSAVQDLSSILIPGIGGRSELAATSPSTEVATGDRTCSSRLFQWRFAMAAT